MRNITTIYVHTAAKRNRKNGRVLDSTIAGMRRYHRMKHGWRDVGYHALIRLGGKLERGRPDEQVGAGVRGANRFSLHVCLAGHGDYAPISKAQWPVLVNLLDHWCQTYGIPTSQIKGHREFWEDRMVKPEKTCPGKLVNMDEVRMLVAMGLPDLEPGDGSFAEDSPRHYNGPSSVPWGVEVGP